MNGKLDQICSLIKNNGCPNCVVRNIYTIAYYEKYNIPDHECFLYIVEFHSDQEVFIKVGITKHENVKYRFRGYKHYEIQTVLVIRSTFYKAYSFEQELLYKFRDFKYKPLNKFKGHTEVLDYSCKSQLMSSLLEIVEEKSL